MKPILIKLLFGVLAILFASCRKDKVEQTPYLSTQDELNYFFSLLPDQETVTVFTLKPGGITLPDTVLTTALGTRIYLIDTDALFQLENGTPQPCKTCQTIKVEVTEVRDKTDWISRQLPAYSASESMLQHTPAISIKATCNGQYIDLLSDRHIRVQTPADHLLENMQLYYLSGDQSNWVPGEENSIFWAEWSGANATLSTGYEFLMRKMGWMSGGKILPANSYSRVCLDLPRQYDAENTRAFLVFNGRQCVAPFTADSNGRLCIEQVPQGYATTIITVTKAGPNWWIARKLTETASDNAIIPLQPAPVTEDEALQVLLSL